MSLETVSKTIIVDTEDLKFANESIKVKIGVVQSIVEKKLEIQIEIKFTLAPLEFDLTDFTVDPITCSKEDAEWSMKLPAVKSEVES